LFQISRGAEGEEGEKECRNAKERDSEETSFGERERGRGTIPVRRENFLEIKVVMCLDVNFVSLNNACKLFHLRSIL